MAGGVDEGESARAAERERERERQEVRAATGEHSMYGYEMNAATFVRRNAATFVLRCEPTKR